MGESSDFFEDIEGSSYGFLIGDIFLGDFDGVCFLGDWEGVGAFYFGRDLVGDYGGVFSIEGDF